MSSPDFKGIPRYISSYPEDTPLTNAQKGAEVLGLPLLPQNELVAKVLEAKREDGKLLWPKVVIQLPRRSSKTSGIQQVLLGRCFNIDNYKVVQTAQSQAIARRVFLDMIYTLEAAYPDPDNRPFTARIGNGQESLRWDNGSQWWVVAPRASSYRSQSADVLFFDEGGEYSAEQTQDLIEGALPLLDTRDASRAQVIVAGTPAKIREGMLWNFLTHARAGKARYGIVDFSMRPEDDPTDEDVWWRVHAGLAAGLTDIDIIRERFETMPLISFQREYLCADPSNASIAAIDPDDWKATSVEKMPPIPVGNFTVAFDVQPDGQSGAICLAYYTEAGLPHIQVIDYRAGYSWIPGEIAKLLKEHRGLEVVFDSIGNNNAVFTTLQRTRGIPLTGLRPLTMKDCASGASLLTSAVADRALVHTPDRDLDAAVEGASFRFVGDSRLFGRRTSTEDVSPLVAAANALYIAAGKRHRAEYKRRPVTLL